MSLATWVLNELRALMPNEAIFDGPRSGRTFDGRPVPPAETRCVVVHTIMPRHDMVTLKPTQDLATARIIVHTFAETRRELESRQAKIKLLKNRAPSDPGYEWSLLEHDESRRADPDPNVPIEHLHAIDSFKAIGFEKPR